MVIKILILSLLVFSCSEQEINLEDSIRLRYENGMQHYNNDKFNKAKDEFEFIIMNNPGSKYALQAQFYLAESLYELKEFYEAEINYDQYARFSNDENKVEESRYKLCLCMVNETLGYKKDQNKTEIAIERLQEFIDDYPNSEYDDDAAVEISRLRTKVAKKDIESARLYVKLNKYKSAHIYLNDVLLNYYDLDIADDARILIIFIYILQDKRAMAIDYLKREKINFINSIKLEEATMLINETENGFQFSHYMRLYK